MANQVVIKDTAARQWLRFAEPSRVIEARRIEDLLSSLQRVEAAVRQDGLYAAGFIAYEAAPAFDRALRVRPAGACPLAWFGLYPPPEPLELPAPPAHPAYTLGAWAPTVGRAEYDEAIARIKAHIARGDTYQVNYTYRLRAPFGGQAWDLFLELAQAQQADYAAYVDTGRFALCSASPELFFRLDGLQLTSRPMKGTAARGRWLAEDEAQAAWLRRSEKNRAENVMIVDMVRNDMGRIARVGSVHVPRLFEVERYPTVWHMTSTVSSTTDASLIEVLEALFPCASITGAPKVRTMQIIAALETTPRGVYTGCIGYVTPGRQAQFNVAIRTVTVDRETGQAEYGVGGGIVWDSEAGEEYEECQIKSRVLAAKQPDFSLLETMLWTPGEGLALLDYHLRRLRDSAAYFGIPADLEAVRERLTALADSLPPLPHRVRLLVARDGAISCHASVLDTAAPGGPVRLKLAPTPVDPRDPFLYHKTTRRQVYDAARAAWPSAGDVILWNERGEATETTIANLVARLDGELVTPPVACGLLPGTYRAWLLDTGQVREEVVTLEALRRCERIYLVNSVRGWREAAVDW